MSERALAWTLIHFLWQGALLGVVAAAAMAVARRPEVRYGVGCLFLLAMAVAPVATYLTLTGERIVFEIELTVAATAVAGATAAARTVGVEWTWWLARFWMTGTTLLMARAVGGWMVAWRRSRSGRTRLVGMRGGVAVYESLTAVAPYVFGALKPVVLIPAGALLRLSAEQLEAVVEHELAHIRRHDYAVNLVQTLVEGVLFYHPAVWWLSARIRHERELCCDDAAVRRCGDRLEYSRALLELEQARGAFQMAATGGRLSARIGRILGMEQRRISIAPVVSTALVMMVWGGMVWAQKEPVAPPAPPAPAKVAKPAKPAIAPEPPAPPETVVVDGKTYRRKHAVAPAPPAAPHAPRMANQDAALAEIVKKMAEIEKQQQMLEGQRRELEHAAQRQMMEADRVKQRAAELQAQASKIEAQAAQMEKMAAEIERRMKYAEDRFKENGVSGLLTDRGRTYLKHGPPDEIETHAGGKEAWRWRGGLTVEFEAGKLKSVSSPI